MEKMQILNLFFRIILRTLVFLLIIIEYVNFTYFMVEETDYSVFNY